jgi:predicted site-specific integrase-resolvase
LPLTPTDKDSKTDAFEIHFPKSLAKELCQKIIRHLQEIKIPSQAQRLVDYFAQCLQKGKVHSPIAYFINLKKRLLNNQLELPEDPKIVKVKQEEQSTLNELRYKYQQAITDHNQLKQQIKTISNENNCTFEQALESIGYTMIWQKAGAKLEAIKQSLQPYYQEKFS